TSSALQVPSGVKFAFKNSKASAMCLEVAAMARGPPAAEYGNGLPIADGNSQRSTLLKISGIGPAPLGPQSNSHCQSPPVAIATLPWTKPWYLIGSHGF